MIVKTKLGYYVKIKECWHLVDSWGRIVSLEHACDSDILHKLFSGGYSIIDQAQYNKEIEFAKSHVVVDFQ